MSSFIIPSVLLVIAVLAAARAAMRHGSRRRTVEPAPPATVWTPYRPDNRFERWTAEIAGILEAFGFTFGEVSGVPGVVFPEWYADGDAPFIAVARAGEHYSPLGDVLKQL